MSLLGMSPIQDGLDSPCRKRSHEEYLGQAAGEAGVKKAHLEPESEKNGSGARAQSPSAASAEFTTPCSPVSLTADAENTTAARPSPPPNSTNAGTAESMPQLVICLDPAAPVPSIQSKRKRLTPQEREEKAKVDAQRKQEREEQKAALEAKKQAQAEEREKKRKQKEQEDKRKAEEKERKRREKEEEERKIQEAKEKKERAQTRLNSFFTAGASTPKTAPASATAVAKSPGAGSPSRAAATEVSEYDRMFKPFFVKENVVMATSLHGPDEKTKEAKSKILDEYISGKRGSFTVLALNATTATEYFCLSCRQQRGRRRPAVRDIVAVLSDMGMEDSASPQRKAALDQLKATPLKFLGFREDVRPAYYGTVTNIPEGARLSKLARNPLAKDVLPLSYDYDSEAEWVDDGDGEDVDDLDDDEEEVEEDEEMADFLDDSEDALPLRAAFSGGMEPESTGLCWEDERNQSPLDMNVFRMEFILDCQGPIDPLSTKYWEAEPAEPVLPTEDVKVILPSSSSSTAMPPPPVPTDALAALGMRPPTGAAAKADPKKAVVASEFIGDFKRAIVQYAKLSKLGIVEILSAEFEKCTKSQIKNSLEAMAERTGAGNHKTWKLKDGVAL